MLNADIFEERDDWRHPLALSVAFHAFLFGGIVLYAVLTGGVGESWGGIGGGGGAMSATLVSSVPLPAAATETQNVLANESKGLSQSLPKPKEEPVPEAIPIPDRNAKRTTREATVRTPTREPVKPVEEQPSNVVPFGEGGPVSGPYGSFSSGGAKGGIGFTGGGGDFGSRYGWYVDVVRRKISESWGQVDPRIGVSPNRTYVVFDISRDGRPQNVRLEQSSGIPSLDQSAVRAVMRVDTFGPLPPDYSGSKVSVEFWFDYRH